MIERRKNITGVFCRRNAIWMVKWLESHFEHLKHGELLHELFAE